MSSERLVTAILEALENLAAQAALVKQRPRNSQINMARGFQERLRSTSKQTQNL
jgi:hypothetical protein